MMRNILLFIAGFVYAMLLLKSPAVEAASSALMFGSFGGQARAVAVDGSGYVSVVLN